MEQWLSNIEEWKSYIITSFNFKLKTCKMIIFILKVLQERVNLLIHDLTINRLVALQYTLIRSKSKFILIE